MAQNRKTATEGGRKYNKEELFCADRLKAYRDLIEALLEPERLYTLEEAEKKVNQFLKGKVK